MYCKKPGVHQVTTCPQAVVAKCDVVILQTITMMNLQITMVHCGQVLFFVGILCAILKHNVSKLFG